MCGELGAGVWLEGGEVVGHGLAGQLLKQGSLAWTMPVLATLATVGPAGGLSL